MLPCAPAPAGEKHFRLQELTDRVCGHHVCPTAQGPPASNMSRQLENLSAPANAMSGRETKEITVIDFFLPCLTQPTALEEIAFATTITTRPGCQGDLQEAGLGTDKEFRAAPWG